MPSKRKVITIDPGNNTGYAVWEPNKRKPVTGIIRSTEKEVEAFLYIMLGQMEEVVEIHKPFRAVIEGVQVWGDLKSITSARRGNLMKLSYLVGGYFTLFGLQGIGCKIVNPQHWKGQMNKDAVALRVEREIGETYKTDHVTDAVGIGLAERGIL